MKNKKNSRYGLFISIFLTLGSIIWLFIDIVNKNNIAIDIVFIIVAFTIVLFNLKNYLKIHDTRNSIGLKILKYIVSFMLYIFLVPSIVIIFITFYVVISLIQQIIFIKGEYMIYLIKAPYSYITFVMIFIGGIFIVEKVYKVTKGFTLLDKIFAVLAIPLIYILITSITVVTEDGIYDYSFYNLKGKKYSFNDIEYVNTGFNDRGRSKGEFYYNVQFNDGKKLKLSYPSAYQISEEYEHDTWQEYVDMDKYIMDAGAKKESSENGVEYVTMDKIYVDKLLKVIRNK